MSTSGRVAPILFLLPALVAGAALPWQDGWISAIAAIIVLGVPHGALDVEIGRNLLRGRLSRWWFPVFALPYLFLVGVVLLAWRWAPETTLAGFLLASIWHFGTEDTGGGGLPALARGGLPIAIPVLLQPTATARLLSAVTGLTLDGIPHWLLAGSIAWLIPFFAMVLRSQGRGMALPAALCVAFAILPPLTAFSLYFVAVHAPAHIAALIRHPRRTPRVRDAASAWRLALPTTLLTVAIGCALWPLHAGPTPVRLACITVQLLAGLTLPHMILDTWLNQADKRFDARRQLGGRRSGEHGGAGRPDRRVCATRMVLQPSAQ